MSGDLASRLTDCARRWETYGDEPDPQALLLEAAATIATVHEVLRALYSAQAATDEAGGREVAAWYYLGDLENELGQIWLET